MPTKNAKSNTGSNKATQPVSSNPGKDNLAKDIEGDNKSELKGLFWLELNFMNVFWIEDILYGHF